MGLSVDVTAAVRKVLVKNWLDMGKVRLQVAGKLVIVRGRLIRTRDDEPVTGVFIEELEQQIRTVKGVKFLRWILEGWKYDKGKWEASK